MSILLLYLFQHAVTLNMFRVCGQPARMMIQSIHNGPGFLGTDLVPAIYFKVQEKFFPVCS